MPPFDAWVLRRLMCGFMVNAELSCVSPCYRSLAFALASTSPAERGGVLNEYLEERQDQEAILWAMADQDPLGPPPGVEPPDKAFEAIMRRPEVWHRAEIKIDGEWVSIHYTKDGVNPGYVQLGDGKDLFTVWPVEKWKLCEVRKLL